MEQFIFFALLYSLGLMFGMMFYHKIPLAFLALTAFFWGALGWVTLTLILCSFGLPFTFRLMAIVETFIVISLAIYFSHNNGRNLQRVELQILLSVSLFFILITVLSMKLNASNLTNDSYYMILYGEIIAFSGLFSGSPVMTPFAYGIFMPVIQSAAPFLRLEYLYAFQPIFSFLFLGTMFYLINYTIRKTIQNKVYAFFLSALGVLVFATTPGVLYHIFYIHTSFTTASYLFLSIVTFWLGQREDNHTWFILSALALLAFSLVRTETPVFTLFVVALMIKHLNFRNRVTILLPLVLIILLWQVASLFLFPENEFAIVSTPQTILFICFYAIFALFILSTKQKMIGKFIVPYISHYLIAGSALGIIVMYIAKPRHMLENLTNIVQNMFQAGGWGITWSVVLFLLVFSYLLPRFRNEEMFLLNIISFFVFILALGFFREPYYVRWTDSANRMSLHILPLSIFYLTVKYSQIANKGNKVASAILIN